MLKRKDNTQAVTKHILKTANTRSILLILILVTGIAVRLINYFSNAGLWLDEALLSLNLLDKSFSQLCFPLDNNQVAPLLFLFIERLNVIIFGPGELSLRLFPLLCSISSLLLIFLVAKGLMKNDRPAMIALLILALSPIQIRYSAEVKQYMTDEFIFLLLIYLFLRFRVHKRTNALALFGIAGIISIFLSNIAVLVLFTIGIYWIISDVRSKQFNRNIIIVLSSWIIVFGFYFYFLRAPLKTLF